jgi:hypothetical protein
VPGRPSLYSTTRSFLDDLKLRSLDELPPLDELGTLLDSGLEGAVGHGVALPSGESATPEALVQGD